MAGGKTLTVYLAADLSKFNGGLDKATTGLSGFQKGLMAAGAAAGAFAVGLAVDAVQAAMAEEAELTKLNTTLENLGFGAASQQVNGFIDNLQYASGVADSELRPAFDRLIRSTGNITEAQRALQIALNVSAGTGKSLESVTSALGKAYDGNTTALGKLGIGIDKAALASGDLNYITSKLAETFDGQTAKAAGTLKGQMDRLKIAGDELIEAFGTGIVSAFGDTQQATDDMIAAMRNAQGPVSGLGAIAGKAAQGGLTFLTDMLRGLTSTGGVLWALGKLLGIDTAAMNDAADAANELAGSLNSVANSAYKPGPAVIQLAEHAFRAAETSNSFAGSLDEVDRSLTRTSGSLERVNPQIEAQTNLVRGLITRLGEEKTALDNAVAARDAYAASLSSNITSGTNLKDFFDPKDVEGSIAKYAAALGNDAKFSDALAKLGSSLPNTPGAQAFLNNIVGLGTVSGQAFLDGLTPKIAEDLVKQLDDSTATINGNAFLLANKFYGEGIEAATQLIDGTVVQIAKEEKRLRKIGQNIGKPIGANIKAEIAQAVADAVAAAEAAKTAAAAERAAKAAATNVTVTEQQVAKALQSLIVNADKRSTGQVGVLQ